MSASLTDDIMDYLVAQGVTGTITRGYMPDAPADVVTLYEYAGRPAIMTHDGAKLGQPGLQVVVRGTAYDTARAKLQQVEDVLDGKVNITLAGTVYQSISAIQSAIPLGWENGKIELAQNYSIMRDR